jgi:hypothetical protein
MTFSGTENQLHSATYKQLVTTILSWIGIAPYTAYFIIIFL